MEDCALFHFGHPTLMRRMYEEEGAEGEESLRGHIRTLGDGCMELGAKTLLMKCGGLGMYCRRAGLQSAGGQACNAQFF